LSGLENERKKKRNEEKKNFLFYFFFSTINCRDNKMSVYRNLSTQERSTSSGTSSEEVVTVVDSQIAPTEVEQAEESPAVEQKEIETPVLHTNFSSIHETNAVLLSVVDNLEKYVAQVIESIRENIQKNKIELELIKQQIIQDMQDFEARINSFLA